VPERDLRITAVSPNGQTETEFRLSYSEVERIRRDGPAYKFNELLNLKETLQKPVAIFKGLQRQNFAASFCYVGKPKHSYSNDGEVRPWDQRFVFVVYVRDDLRIIDWEKLKSDRNNPDLPEDWNTRFDETLWKP
jgi:hypothetical protein